MIRKNYFFRLKYFSLTKLKTQMTRHSSLQCLHAFSVKRLLRPLYFVVVQGRQRNVGEKCDARTVQSYFFCSFNLFLCLKFSYTFRENLCPNLTQHFKYQSDFPMTLKNSFGKRSLFVLSASVWKDQSTDSSFSRQRETQHGGSIVRLANRFAV